MIVGREKIKGNGNRNRGANVDRVTQKGEGGEGEHEMNKRHFQPTQ